mmetsp:Transcript_10121/g.26269  ORF Transcript_10121/g.26269 Transcript_10121/m.26269 type:complete len:2025 (-) Transcript_10121:314-6388(-)
MVAGSVSGSSVSSGGSRSSTASARARANKSAAEQEEDEGELLNQRRGVIQPAFSVLHTLAQVKYDYLLRFTAARIILEFLQLLLLVLRPAYGFEINTDLWVWHAIKWVEFANPLTSDSYEFYVAWIYVGVVVLVLSVGVGVWISWCHKNNNFPYIWPVMLLRLVVNATVFVFYISCFSVFLAAFNCNWFTEGTGEIQTRNGTEVVDLRFRMHRFPEIECLQTPHIAHGIVALISCGVFTLIAYAVTLTEFEPDPSSRRYMATPHSSVELWALTAKTLMALNMAIFAGQLYIQSVIMCLMTLTLCYLYIRWQPYFNEWVNHIRSGLFCMLFWTSAFIAIMKFDHRRERPGHLEWLTDIMLYGLAPVLVFGAGLSFARLRLSTRYILKVIRNAPPDIRLKDVYWFSTPQEVEIVSRTALRRWLPEDDEVLDPDAVNEADHILQIGQAHFPDDPQMVLAFANFLISIKKSHQTGSSLLQHVSKLEDVSLGDQFIVFVRMEEQKLRSKTQDPSEGTLDLVAYVEFQRNYRMLARSQRTTLMTISTFWKSLAHQDIAFSSLVKNLTNISDSAKNTDKIFKVMLERYPNNEHLYRMYARFLEHVKSDPWTAQKFTETAEKLEEEQDQTGANLIGQDDASSLLENVNEKIHAVLVINAEGIMLVANKQLQKLFGYKKTEMEGKNVSMMMPQPFSQRHNGYLRNYVSTGKKRILDSVREVVALHKNRNVFPIQLAVTKVSGVGNDSVFMGVMRPYTVEAGVIRVWCTPSGGVISVDERFFDSFGKKYSEVAGRPFSSLVRDQDVIMKLLERAQAASEEDFVQGRVREPEMYMLHAYLDPIKVELQVDLGGTDTQRLLAFNIRLLETQGMLQVVNNEGRVLYMNEDMRKFLGVKDIAAIKHANLANQMPAPFNFLHSRWMKEPNAKVPKQSCRASATVVMLNGQGKSTPVKPRITSREVDEHMQHAVQVEPSSFDRGLDERRLTFRIDTQGNVLDVNATAPTSLFGFCPSAMVGGNISSVVDVLSKMREELPSVLAKMAQKVAAKPGYSWRVGVSPPAKPWEEMSELDKLVQQRSTRPALMMLELQEVEEEDVIPEIRIHLYKAEMVTGVIAMDHRGIITKPACCVLHPSGLLFGCSARSMMRQPIQRYLNLPGKGPESLLQDNKVKGAMKKGTVGKKVGPLKVINGIHADGTSLQLNVLTVSTTAKHFVAKASFATTEVGDVDLFRASLEGREGKSRRMSGVWGGSPAKIEAGMPKISMFELPAQEVAKPSAAAAARPEGGGIKKGVKFAGAEKDADAGSEDASSSSESSSTNSEERLEQEEEMMDALEEEAMTSEDGDSQEHAVEEEGFVDSDWQRGRRLKKLHQLLTSKQATVDQTRYVHHTYAILALLLVVHTVLFGVWVSRILQLNDTAREIDGNGKILYAVETILINCQKIMNMYQGMAHQYIYAMSESEMKLTEERLYQAITDLEEHHQGVYLGFDKLRHLRDEYQLRDLWEGSSLQEELFIDVRVPKLEEEQSNLWLMGNQFAASAREVLHNHEYIAKTTNNSFDQDRNWQYVMQNGPEVLASKYLQSLSGLLQRDLAELDATTSLGWGLMVVDLIVSLACIFWTFYLLKSVSQVRHMLFSVFLVIPSSYCKALAEKQVKMAEEEAEGGADGGDDDDEDGDEEQQQQQQHKPHHLPGMALPSVVPGLRPALLGPKHKNDAANPFTFVVDVNQLASPTDPLSRTARLTAHLRAMWARVAAWANKGMALVNRFSEAPIEVGKRKLLRYSKDTYILVAPLVVWLILVIVLFSVATTQQSQLRQPLIDNYMADRLIAKTAKIISDAHMFVSQSSAQDVVQFLEGKDSDLPILMNLYNGLLYGQGKEEKLDTGFLELDGTLFDTQKNSFMFFQDDKCHAQYRRDTYCFVPGDYFYEVTSHGIDAMMLKLFDEIIELVSQDPAHIAKEQLGVRSFDYIWNVAWYSLTGALYDASAYFSERATSQFISTLNAQIALIVIAYVAAAAYYFLLFAPFKAKLRFELRQVRAGACV